MSAGTLRQRIVCYVWLCAVLTYVVTAVWLIEVDADWIIRTYYRDFLWYLGVHGLLLAVASIPFTFWVVNTFILDSPEPRGKA